jgi:signal transduction histidine kinase
MADAGHLRISKEPLYLEEVLEETCAFAGPMAHAKQIQMRRELQRDVAFSGDPAFLRQLFLIFVDNAIKYSPPNSRIGVRLFTADHSVWVQFQDEGIGIQSEYIPRIFERFFRVPQPHPTDTQSGGLGLAIAQAIVQAHEGRIDCESQPGVGTLFTVVLPMPLGIQINKN